MIFLVIIGIFVAFVTWSLLVPWTYIYDVATLTPAPFPTGENPNFLTQVNDCFIPTADATGYDLRITSGFRSATDQSVLYQQGRTVDGHIVTEAPPGRSLHNYGYAVDVADRTAGYNLNWQKLVQIATYCGLANGGTGDLPHFEYRGGLTTLQFYIGMRPKPLTLPCPIMAVRAHANQPLTLADLQACNAPSFSG